MRSWQTDYCLLFIVYCLLFTVAVTVRLDDCMSCKYLRMGLGFLYNDVEEWQQLNIYTMIMYILVRIYLAD